ncbi:hypothetical protein AMAG_03329 [Allomyces macrogynus ATCC 38327]|uniref:FHA domain-containing protein n=1 Tax=Allomyces macrogynus (strain ATCC 38327) TaxID=578462 RepID=A0A0L0S8S6_ALLM3|nr:hypothetical protein AMAG_03329 [Allomyces macrogynus ATCC 38327]|eukprot:KNE58973.1 hypothetical protein AMAG_03329 [Allomyces macrogynus ATCC 38327]
MSGDTGAPPVRSATPVKSAPTSSTAWALPAWVVRDGSTGLLPIYGRTDRGVVLGRGPQCTYDVGGVSTCSRKISRRHALLAWDAQARGFRLCVLGLNGAALNGTHYYPDDCVPVDDEPDPRPLVRKGDIVELPGNVKLVFRGAALAPYPDSPIVCRVAEPSAELASSPLRPALASMQLALGPAPTSPTLASAVPPTAPRAPPLLGAKRPAESAALDAQMLAESPPDIQPPPMSLQDIIIESFTFCGRSDLSLGELYTEIAQNQAYFRAARGDSWKRAVLRALERTPFFALRPKNKLLTRATQWYYDPDRDIDRGRARRYAEFGSAQPSRRAKARADKTYFFVDMTARKARNRDRYEEEPAEPARNSRRRSARGGGAAREVVASDEDEDGPSAWQAPSSEATVPGTPLLKRRRMELRLDEESAQGGDGEEDDGGSSARRRLFRSR